MLLVAASAWAAGYYFLDSGVRAQGRGGAFVAGADDLSAQYYNPAALVRLSRPMVHLEGWALSQMVAFDREDEPGWNPYEEVENEAPPFVEPSGGVALPLKPLFPWLGDTTVAVGLYEPTSPLLAYPAGGPQRYALISAEVLQAYAGPSIAHRFTPWLSVGAGLELSFLSVKQSLAAQVCLDSSESCPSDDPSNDVVLDLDVVDPARVSWNAGVLLEPARGWSVGLSVQPAIHFEPEGEMVTTFSEDNGQIVPQLASTEFTDEDVRLLVDLPWIVRAGVQVAPTERIRVELAGSWAGWSGTPELTITDVDLQIASRDDGALQGQVFTVTDDVVFPTGFQDAWSLRLGGEYDLSKQLVLRAGGHWESSAVPDELVGVIVADGPKAGGGVGGGVRFGRVTLDASAMAQVEFAREVTNSVLKQQVLVINTSDFSEPPAITQGKVVGNGTLSSTLLVAGLALTVDLGRGGGDRP